MNGRPRWLTEPCPAWCAGEHHDHDHLDDRLHRDSGAVVPAILAWGDLARSYRPTAGELTIQRVRAVGGDCDWVTIQEAEGRAHRLVLEAESARRLASALRRLS